MEVICLQTEAFYTLVEEVVRRMKNSHDDQQDKWIQGADAMKLLGIKSKTTMQKLRDEGNIRFSQPERKIILYDRDSILEYLDKHAKEIF